MELAGRCATTTQGIEQDRQGIRSTGVGRSPVVAYELLAGVDRSGALPIGDSKGIEVVVDVAPELIADQCAQSEATVR